MLIMQPCGVWAETCRRSRNHLKLLQGIGRDVWMILRGLYQVATILALPGVFLVITRRFEVESLNT